MTHDPVAVNDGRAENVGTGSLRVGRYAPLLRLACVWGLLIIAAVLLRGAFRGGGAHSDFALFWETVERVRGGLPMYGPLTTGSRVWLAGPNYNPPHFYLLVAPFTVLPFAAGFVLWTLTGLACALYAARRTLRTLNLRAHGDAVLLGGLVLANATLASTLRAGQLSLFLALPVCLAWIAAREQRWTHTGLWIGLAASVKPFLLIVGPYLLLTRRWRAAFAMTFAGITAFALGAALFGPHSLRDWIGVLDAPRMDAHFHNASFAALLIRGFGSRLLPATEVLAAAGTLATVVIAARSRDTDHAWLTLLTGSLFWSPLGWIYYGWILMPPLFALAVTRRLAPLGCGWVLLWLWPPYTPSLATARPIVATTIGSIYTWGLMLLWVGEVTTHGNRRETPDLRAHRRDGVA